MSYFEYFPLTFYDITKQGDLETSAIITKDIIRRVKVNSRIATSAFSYDLYDVKEGERPDILAHDFYNSSKFAWVILLTNEIHDVYEDWPRTERELKNMITKKYGGLGPYALFGTGTSGMHTGTGYWFPIFLNAKEAREYNRYKQNGTGISHTHTFSEFGNTVFHMPGNYGSGHAMSTYDSNLYKLWTINSGPDGVHHYERPAASGDVNRKIRTTETTYTLITSPGTEQTFNSDVITNRLYEERLNEEKRQIKILRPNLVQEFVEEFKEIIGN